MELQSQLKKFNWEYKLDLYMDCFDYVNNIKEVSTPELSVVVISWRLHKDTLVNFKKLHEQRKAQNFELIFVNNGASVEEFSVLEPYINTYIKLKENTGAYLARNIGAVFTNSPILFFLEDDGIPDEQLIDSHLLAHKRYDVISVAGIYLYKTDNVLNEIQTHYYSGDMIFPKFSNLEGNTSYLSKSFFEVGGWDDAIKFGGGGKELAIRLFQKYPIYSKQIYSPYSIIYHDYVADENHLERKLLRQKQSFARLEKKHRNWAEFKNEWAPYVRKQGTVVLKSREIELEKKFDALMSHVLKRNNNKISSYMSGIIFIDDIERNRTLLNSLKSKNLVIFGCGLFGRNINKMLLNQNIKISYFCDNNKQIWNENIDGVKVISPTMLTEDYYILIASQWSFDISIQLQGLGLKAGEHYKRVIY
ncbi:glycosyltransferase [Alkalihalobacillus trypoxylicola]|uniref:Glycosyltransferase 2-like domain-containing protein n=1 Tax=Alkalihalobacillus trypoxylicola TaxID=519424 RepID=A0A162ETS0_9BACI|nr:glycosyltransferase [Alkalihalobacillus trypoxylicola]KYG33706.1 hypothetical protein AZF04_15895 [Alkalihalobacillus trypoxylicola]